MPIMYYYILYSFLSKSKFPKRSRTALIHFSRKMEFLCRIQLEPIAMRSCDCKLNRLFVFRLVWSAVPFVQNCSIALLHTACCVKLYGKQKYFQGWCIKSELLRMITDSNVMMHFDAKKLKFPCLLPENKTNENHIMLPL